MSRKITDCSHSLRFNLRCRQHRLIPNSFPLGSRPQDYSDSTDSTEPAEQDIILGLFHNRWTGLIIPIRIFFLFYVTTITTNNMAFMFVSCQFMVQVGVSFSVHKCLVFCTHLLSLLNPVNHRISVTVHLLLIH